MNKVIGYWADWASLNEQGYSRSEGPDFDDTLIPGNMASPLSDGRYYLCSSCGQKYEVPSCMLEDTYHTPHFHGATEIVIEVIGGCRHIHCDDAKKQQQELAQSMIAALNEGFSPSQLFEM